MTRIDSIDEIIVTPHELVIGDTVLDMHKISHVSISKNGPKRAGFIILGLVSIFPLIYLIRNLFLKKNWDKLAYFVFFFALANLLFSIIILILKKPTYTLSVTLSYGTPQTVLLSKNKSVLLDTQSLISEYIERYNPDPLP